MLAALLLCLSVAIALPAQEPAPLRLSQDQVAVWNGGSISTDRFDRFLGANAHYQQSGVEALTHILQIKLVELEAEARGLHADPKAVEARIEEAIAQIEAAGKSLEVLLSARQMGMTEFRKLIGDSLLHEQLVRTDLKLGTEDAISPAMLQQWTDARIAELLQLSMSAPPGMALDAPPYRVSEQELGATIRQTMGNEDLVGRVEQLVLMDALPQWASKHMLPLTDDILYQEIEWRRKRVEENPAYGGMTYEGILKTKNSTVEAVLESEELRVAGYLRLLTRQRFPESWFDELDAAGRLALEREYGASRHIGWLLLRAHEEKADDLDLTFDEADAELRKLLQRMQSAEDFMDLAGDYSEDEHSRRRKGMVGWVHLEEEGVASALSQAAFDAPGKGIFGPVKIVDENPFAPLSGMALLLVTDVRESPAESEFRSLVRRGQHMRLRQGFLKEINLHQRWQRRFPDVY